MEKSSGKDQNLQSWIKLTKHLSAIIVKNHLPFDTSTERVAALIESFVSRYGLGDLEELLGIYHKIKGHQDSRIKLKCGAVHCIQCYYTMTSQIQNMQPDIVCTCKMKVPPNFRYRIEQEYLRIERMKVTCVFCGENKDRMEFAVIASHKCPVCSNCIIKSFVYQKGIRNRCPKCIEDYNDESETLARSVCETVVPPEIQREFYSGYCSKCGNEGDTRTFEIICESNHEYCTSCTKSAKDSKATTCTICGLALSLPTPPSQLKN